jgi:hypothetical protein
MTKDRRPRCCRPCLEGLEARDLPSTWQVVGPNPGHRGANGPYLNLIVVKDSSRGGGAVAHRVPPSRGQVAPTPPWVNEDLLQGLASTLSAPVTTTRPIQVGNLVFAPGTYPVPQPTRSEIRRETLWAEFVGRYWVGPPRFSDQAATIHIYSDGKSVTSNQFLKGRAQILLFPPADPTATPTSQDPLAGQVAGLLSLFAANILQSGTVLFAEVTNVPGVASNDPTALDHGLPSHLEFLIDPNGVSGGIYSTPAFTTTPATVTDPATGQALPLIAGSGGAVAFSQGTGIIDIKYSPDHRLRTGATQSGKVVVRIQGLNNITSVLNPIYKGIN